MNDTPAAGQPFVRLTPDGESDDVTRELAEEVPIALEFNGIGYAVLMATPADIEDLVAGFLIAERLQLPGDAVLDVALHRTERGIVARANLGTPFHSRTRMRHTRTRSACQRRLEPPRRAPRTSPASRAHAPVQRSARIKRSAPSSRTSSRESG